jgi:hypothetical protein
MLMTARGNTESKDSERCRNSGRQVVKGCYPQPAPSYSLQRTRCPEREACEAEVVVCAAFARDRVARRLPHRAVEGARGRDWQRRVESTRKSRIVVHARSRNAMRRLGPPLVGRHADGRQERLRARGGGGGAPRIDRLPEPHYPSPS